MDANRPEDDPGRAVNRAESLADNNPNLSYGNGFRDNITRLLRGDTPPAPARLATEPVGDTPGGREPPQLMA